MNDKGELILNHKMWNVIIYTIVFEFWCFLVLLLAIGFFRRGLKYDNTFELISGLIGIITLLIMMIIMLLSVKLSRFDIYTNGIVIGISLKEYIQNRNKFNKSYGFNHFNNILKIDTKHDWIIIETKEKTHLIGFLSKKTKNRVLSMLIDTKHKFNLKNSTL